MLVPSGNGGFGLPVIDGIGGPWIKPEPHERFFKLADVVPLEARAKVAEGGLCSGEQEYGPPGSNEKNVPFMNLGARRRQSRGDTGARLQDRRRQRQLLWGAEATGPAGKDVSRNNPLLRWDQDWRGGRRSSP
jgi:hypothetical protein